MSEFGVIGWLARLALPKSHHRHGCTSARSHSHVWHGWYLQRWQGRIGWHGRTVGAVAAVGAV
ncbi:hypothetical protein [Microcoleus sp. S13_B4]|uniref:hypothetical protein n=1 Tax=Microcoleus sp. S13_B4 TaxID=3055408 RepID=UPI002FD06C81